MAGFISGWPYGAEYHSLPKRSKERKFALTPTGSQTDLSCFAAKPLPPSRHGSINSPLFQLLPPEIRTQILIMAFGNRTLHMDLVLSHPPLTVLPSYRTNAILGHAGIYVEPGKTNTERLYPVLDTSVRQSWYWLGSVCHRSPPDLDDSSEHSVQPYQDQCRDGITLDHNCRLWPGQSPNKCRIGAIGWLQSCWQAYVEGIPILYGENTIHTCSKLLILRADQLFLPQRLAAITSLELLWDFGSGPPWAESFASKAREEMDDFETMLHNILFKFRGLKRLYISIQWTGRPPQVVHGRSIGSTDNVSAETGLMQPVDGMMRRLPLRVASFALAIPSSVYQDQCYQVKQLSNGIVEHVSAGAKQERFWRPIVKSAARAGYWVYLGQRDLKLVGDEQDLNSHDRILYMK